MEQSSNLESENKTDFLKSSVNDCTNQRSKLFKVTLKTRCSMVKK